MIYAQIYAVYLRSVFALGRGPIVMATDRHKLQASAYSSEADGSCEARSPVWSVFTERLSSVRVLAPRTAVCVTKALCVCPYLHVCVDCASQDTTVDQPRKIRNKVPIMAVTETLYWCEAGVSKKERSI